MRCPKCGKNMQGDARYCPYCGTQTRRRRSIFDMFFPRFEKEVSSMDRQMGDINKMFEKQFEAFDIRPFFRQPTRGKGFTIKIVRRGGEEPKVSVRSFGDVNKDELERQVKSQFHTDKPVRITFRQGSPRPAPPRPQAAPIPVTTPRASDLPVPEVTEEPRTDASRTDSRVAVNMELPGVKSEHDIRINVLEESVEVKAMAGKKAFFKILTKPARSKLVNKSFKNGKLHLEFA